MRLLYLAHRIPFPPDKGDKIRSYHEVAHLASRHEVTVATLIDDPADRPHVASLRGIVREVIVSEIGPLAARARTLRALVSRQPLSLAHFHDAKLARVVSERIASRAFDAALVFSSSMVPYVGLPPCLPAVLDLVDVDSAKWRQLGERRRGPMGALYRLESRRLAAFERECAEAFATIVVCTDAESAAAKELLAGTRVRAKIEVIRNGIDTERFAYSEPSDRQPEIVFTGAMDYAANADAACWFHDAIWPAVRRLVPQATFTIVGRNPLRAVRALARMSGVMVTGTVPDVRPHLRRAAVAVAPLRVAQGVQNKILEAIASGLPVVATPEAARGLEPEVRAAISVESEPAAFAAAVVRLLRDEAERVAASRLARQALVARYNWPLSMARLEAVLLAAAANSA
ncbi:MAG: TIGR03087 family PEP-CTERM/XrtA system glycosyltransferase [Planctomycetes bacterium]|nr:TIGR03087 family PEP-CTERM/XrtA system glycosyltransferase [Planctomycetota bacterium]MBI3845873.1 TIGR03087 family PEP-CTERM/XrtA system glycosyltransferase [Planctomycetota bacterium]